MDPALAGAILTGLSALLLGVGQIMDRTRFSRAGVREMRRRDRRHTHQLQVAYTHMAKLEQVMAKAGVRVPKRPAELDPDWGLDDGDELAERRAEVSRR